MDEPQNQCNCGPNCALGYKEYANRPVSGSVSRVLKGFQVFARVKHSRSREKPQNYVSDLTRRCLEIFCIDTQVLLVSQWVLARVTLFKSVRLFYSADEWKSQTNLSNQRVRCVCDA